MKTILPLIASFIIIHNVFGQNEDVYPCSLMLPYEFLCSETLSLDTLDLATSQHLFYVDTADSTNLWQFGTSTKLEFANAIGFVTDSTAAYPMGNKSYLGYRLPYWVQNTMVFFEHKIDSDSLFDGGYVQFSCDSGVTWEHLGDNVFGGQQDNFFSSCHRIFGFYNYPTNEGGYSGTTINDSVYAFTGESDWMWSGIQFYEPSIKTSTDTDTPLHLRFVFESDSIASDRAGWMIRNIVIAENFLGSSVSTTGANPTLHVVPNPTSTSFRVLASNFSDVTIEVLDISGRVIITHTNYTGQPIDVSTLPQGIYPVRVSSPNGISTAKLVRN